MIAGIFSMFMGPCKIYAQHDIPIGTWRTHLAYNRAELLENANNTLYCAAENGLFIYDTEQHEIKILSKSDGLSDISISAIRFDKESQTVILGYDDGNIDFIKDYKISNFPEIEKASLLYPKTILDIEINGNTIYFITGFGVVLFNKEKNVLTENWINLGESGDYLRIYKAAVLRDTIFLCTDEGIMAGSLNPAVNLQDYHNWKRYGILEGIPRNRTELIETSDTQLIAVQDSLDVYRYSNGNWEKQEDIVDQPVVSLHHTGKDLLFTLKNKILIMNDQEEIETIASDKLFHPQSSLLVNNELWVADRLNGLVHIAGTKQEVIFPSSPFSNMIKRIYNTGNKIVVVPGGYDPGFMPLRNAGGFSIFENGIWKNYNNSGNSGSISLPEIYDLVDVTSDAGQKNLYFASFGYGILTWDLKDNFNIYDEQTTGCTLVNADPPGRNTFVTSMAFDRESVLWMTNYGVSTPLHELSGNNDWTGYNLSDSRSTYLLKVVITDNEDKWMIINPLYGGGILVYNEANHEEKVLSTIKGAGGLPANEVYDLVIDRKGQIWVATEKGVAYFPYPSLVLTGEDINAILPIYNQGYLFRNEKINCLEIDAGDRKWIGTDKGTWLFSSDGSEQIRNFNTDNSPLISNKILDIAVNGQTGEVFFGTDKGIVSFRADAIEPQPGLTNIKIFPNPVTPGYTGIIGIQGLPGSAIVKITDISGKLVYQTRSEGGIATWNGRDYKGSRASTGIYLVFSSTMDGEDTLVGKIAIIN